MTLLIIDLWQCFVCMYKIMCNPMHPLSGALPGPYVPVQVTHGVLVANRGILMRHLAAEPRSAAGLLFSSLCPSGTILLTLYSMVWDWRGFKTMANVFLLV